MKTLTPMLSLLFCAFLLFSCSQEDDGVYFDESSEIISPSVTYSEIEIEILDLVNEHRLEMGLNELKELNIVSGVADEHTDYMISIGSVNHDNFDVRAGKLMSSAKAKSISENVAYGYKTAQGVVDGWLNSESHRRAIEDSKKTHFGISIESNSQGKYYFTQIFIQKQKTFNFIDNQQSTSETTIMNSIAPQITEKKELHLKIVKNSLNSKTDQKKIYINTLSPDFTYVNHQGTMVFNPKKCVLL